MVSVSVLMVMTKYLTTVNLQRKDLLRFVIYGGVQCSLEGKAGLQKPRHWTHCVHSPETEQTGCEARLSNFKVSSSYLIPLSSLYLVKCYNLQKQLHQLRIKSSNTGALGRQFTPKPQREHRVITTWVFWILPDSLPLFPVCTLPNCTQLEDAAVVEFSAPIWTANTFACMSNYRFLLNWVIYFNNCSFLSLETPSAIVFNSI